MGRRVNTARKFNLDLRPVFRKFGKRYHAETIDNIVSSEPTERGGVTGGSLASWLSNKWFLKIRRTGFTLRFHAQGEGEHANVLQWFVKGTRYPRRTGHRPREKNNPYYFLASFGDTPEGKVRGFEKRGGDFGPGKLLRQPARDIYPVINEEEMVKALGAAARQQFQAWERKAKAR